MAFGDVGGPVTELVITCKTPLAGNVNIKRGDPVALLGDYIVDNATHHFPIFGQALADSDQNGDFIPIKVRGICIFKWRGVIAPRIRGCVSMSDTTGYVRHAPRATGSGLVCKVTETEVHVLL